MKISFFSFIVILLSNICFAQESVYVEADGQVGRGILKSRGSECFVITPNHVVQETIDEVSITGTKIVKSKGKLEQTFSNDIAIVRVNSGGLQKCEEWRLVEKFEDILNNSFEGFLEIKNGNGSNSIMKVLITEKESSYITIRPFFQDDKIVKGLSGSSLLCILDNKKVFMGMLMEVDEAGKGIVLKADIIDGILSTFFSKSSLPLISNENTTIIPKKIVETSVKSIEKSGFKFDLVDYQKSMGIATLKIYVTSLKKEGVLKVYSMNGLNSTKIYDENGIEYITKEIKLASKYSTGNMFNSVGNSYVFAEGVPTLVEITFKYPNESAGGISLLIFSVNIAGKFEKITFRNLSFDSTSKELKIPQILAIQSQYFDGFKFDVVEGKKVGNNIVLKLYITSVQKDAYINVYAEYKNYSTKIYDENGNEYIAYNVKLGTQSDSKYVGDNYTLVQGIPTPVEIRFKNIDSDLKFIRFLNLGINHLDKYQIVKFSDINLIN